MITDSTRPAIDSQIIVTLAKQALNNLPYYQTTQGHFGLSENAFNKEFGTVKIAMPRQSGHSTAALQLMYEYPDALCFVHSGSSANYMRMLLKDYTVESEVLRRIKKNIIVPSPPAINRIKPGGKRSFVILDQTSRIPKEMHDMVISSLRASIVLELG